MKIIAKPKYSPQRGMIPPIYLILSESRSPFCAEKGGEGCELPKTMTNISIISRQSRYICLNIKPPNISLKDLLHFKEMRNP